MADYTRYEPRMDDQGRATIECIDCDVPVWTEDDAIDQVTPISLANFIAHADEHERQEHVADAVPALVVAHMNAEHPDPFGRPWTFVILDGEADRA
jgi:hypothetical protein